METNQLLINYYKKEELKKIKERKQQGLTNDEIINLANKEYITVEEIKKELGIDDKIEQERIVSEKDAIATEGERSQEDIEIVMIQIEKLEDYPNQPFKLFSEEKKSEMIESIKINGIMQPLIVRPLENQNYQILAGHNRKNCAKEIGIKELPCIIKNNLTEDEAKIYLIDTNLCTRENISPMERAKAYKIKYDTYKRKNIKTSMVEEIKKDNLGLARATIIKEEKSSNGTIQRYLRLTYLIPELQKAIEEGKIKINTGEKLSFLPKEEQINISEILEENIKISDRLAKMIKRESEKCKTENIYNYLSKEEIKEIINKKDKLKQDAIKVTFYKNEIEEYLENKNTESEIKDYIFDVLKRIKSY